MFRYLFCCVFLRGRSLQPALPVAVIDANRAYFDAMPARILYQLRWGIKAHWLAVEQGGDKGRRMVTFQPGRDIHQQGEAGRVRFGKAIFAKAQHLLINLLRKAGAVATRQHALNEALLEMIQSAMTLPCRHRTAQLIGFARRETGGDHRQLHHLLLEDRHAQSAFEHRAYRLARIRHRLQPLPPTQIGMHHAALDRPWTDDGDLDHQIVERGRFQSRQHRHLRP